MNIGDEYKEILDSRVRIGELFERLDDDKVRCLACGHRCVISSGKRGVCQIRYTRDSELFVPWGYVSALNNDPIEKKPLFHVLPGEGVLSFGMLGCNLRCPFCQNWEISQTLKDPRAVSRIIDITSEDIVNFALRLGDSMIASTYNEPIITTEWAVEIFKLAKSKGMLTIYVTNGYGTPELIRYLAPHLDAANVDLKSFREENYKWLGGKLEPVLDTIKGLAQAGVWIEITTLIVPKFNDDPNELRDIADFIASISPDIPWHVTAFHPDYRVTDRPRTPTSTLLKAYDIGRQKLKYVYMGNVLAAEYESTYCPECGNRVIERAWYNVIVKLDDDGRCPKCGTPINGIWRKSYKTDTKTQIIRNPVKLKEVG